MSRRRVRAALLAPLLLAVLAAQGAGARRLTQATPPPPAPAASPPAPKASPPPPKASPPPPKTAASPPPAAASPPPAPAAAPPPPPLPPAPPANLSSPPPPYLLNPPAPPMPPAEPPRESPPPSPPAPPPVGDYEGEVSSWASFRFAVEGAGAAEFDLVAQDALRRSLGAAARVEPAQVTFSAAFSVALDFVVRGDPWVQASDVAKYLGVDEEEVLLDWDEATLPDYAKGRGDDEAPPAAPPPPPKKKNAGPPPAPEEFFPPSPAAPPGNRRRLAQAPAAPPPAPSGAAAGGAASVRLSLRFVPDAEAAAAAAALLGDEAGLSEATGRALSIGVVQTVATTDAAVALTRADLGAGAFDALVDVVTEPKLQALCVAAGTGPDVSVRLLSPPELSGERPDGAGPLVDVPDRGSDATPAWVWGVVAAVVAVAAVTVVAVAHGLRESRRREAAAAGAGLWVPRSAGSGGATKLGAAGGGGVVDADQLAASKAAAVAAAAQQRHAAQQQALRAFYPGGATPAAAQLAALQSAGKGGGAGGGITAPDLLDDLNLELDALPTASAFNSVVATGDGAGGGGGGDGSLGLAGVSAPTSPRELWAALARVSGASVAAAAAGSRGGSRPASRPLSRSGSAASSLLGEPNAAFAQRGEGGAPAEPPATKRQRGEDPAGDPAVARVADAVAHLRAPGAPLWGGEYVATGGGRAVASGVYVNAAHAGTGAPVMIKFFAEARDWERERELLSAGLPAGVAPGLLAAKPRGRDGGKQLPPALVLERADFTLREALARARPPRSQVRLALHDAALALRSAHAVAGAVHGGLTPDALVFFGGDGRWRLADWELWARPGARPPPGEWRYALRYAAPEVVAADVRGGGRRPPADPKQDTWALGVVAYEALSGRRFYGAAPGAAVAEAAAGAAALPCEGLDGGVIAPLADAAPDAARLLRNLCRRAARDRWDADAAARCAFLRGGADVERFRVGLGAYAA